MAYLLTDILRLVRDELKDAGEADYTDAVVEAGIRVALNEINKASPYQDVETVTMTDESPFVDVSTISDLLEVVAAYYPVTSTYEYWKNKRNVTRFGNTIRIEMDARPSGNSEQAYLECEKRHTLTELTSTLRPYEEEALIVGASSSVAMSHARPTINRQNVGGGKVPTGLMTWGQLKESQFQGLLASFPPKESSRYQLYSRD